MYKRVKKDSKWTIVHIGNFKIDNLKKELQSYKDEWLIDTSRQEKGYTHRQTQMYRICATDYEWIPGTPIITEQFNTIKDESAKKELFDIYKELEYYYSGKVIRCEFIKMFGNSEVLKHTDGGALLHYSRRVHIPLVTNDLVTFTVYNNTINMKESGWYEINNQLPHSVSNKSDQDRIHLIIDILPDDMLTYKIGEN